MGASTISVRLIDSQSNVTTQVVPLGTTVGEFLSLNKVNTQNMHVSLRVDGEVVEFEMDDELEDGSRVTVTPSQLKGAN